MRPASIEKRQLFAHRRRAGESTYVYRFGFFTWEDARTAEHHCRCQHDCCGCYQVEAYVTPLAFGLARMVEHHYINC